MKEKLVELAQKNAELVLSQDREKIKREEGRTIGAMKEIEHLLGMEGLSRVEAFDISNINGFETVGSMIVYEKGKPKRSDYRKFKLKTIMKNFRIEAIILAIGLLLLGVFIEKGFSKFAATS